MKLMLAIGMAAVCMSGAALAQDHGTSGGVSIPPVDIQNTISNTPDPRDLHDLRAARSQIRLACAVDMQRACEGKTGTGADRCLGFHRGEFSPSCKAAITDFQRAAPWLSGGETYVRLAPYSGRGLKGGASLRGPGPDVGAGG